MSGAEHICIYVYIYILAYMSWQLKQCMVMKASELHFYLFIFSLFVPSMANNSQTYISRKLSKAPFVFTRIHFHGTETSHFVSSNPGIVLTLGHKSALCLQKTSSTEGVKTFPLTDGGCVYSELLQHIKCHRYEYSWARGQSSCSWAPVWLSGFKTCKCT